MFAPLNSSLLADGIAVVMQVTCDQIDRKEFLVRRVASQTRFFVREASVKLTSLRRDAQAWSYLLQLLGLRC